MLLNTCHSLEGEVLQAEQAAVGCVLHECAYVQVKVVHDESHILTRPGAVAEAGSVHVAWWRQRSEQPPVSVIQPGAVAVEVLFCTLSWFASHTYSDAKHRKHIQFMPQICVCQRHARQQTIALCARASFAELTACLSVLRCTTQRCTDLTDGKCPRGPGTFCRLMMLRVRLPHRTFLLVAQHRAAPC